MHKVLFRDLKKIDIWCDCLFFVAGYKCDRLALMIRRKQHTVHIKKLSNSVRSASWFLFYYPFKPAHMLSEANY
jgi:hypothetical protein